MILFFKNILEHFKNPYRNYVFLFVSILFLIFVSKGNTMLFFVLDENMPTITILLIVIVFFFYFAHFFNIVNFKNREITFDTIITITTIFIALFTFMMPKAMNTFQLIQSLQFATRSNCEISSKIISKDSSNLNFELFPHYRTDIYIDNIDFIANNFSSTTLEVIRNTVSKSEIANRLIDYGDQYFISNNLILTSEQHIINRSLIETSRSIASTSCSIIQQEIENFARPKTDPSLITILWSFIKATISILF